MRCCAVATCENEGVHIFPRNEALREQWIRATRIDKQRKIGWHLRKYSCICSKHFTPSDYVESTASTRRNLKRTAVPSIFPWTTFKDLLSLPEPFEIAFNPANASKSYSKSELQIKFVQEYLNLDTETPEGFTDPLHIKKENDTSSEQNISDNLPLVPDESGIVIITNIKEEPTDCDINSDQILKSEKPVGTSDIEIKTETNQNSFSDTTHNNYKFSKGSNHFYAGVKTCKNSKRLLEFELPAVKNTRLN